MNFENAEAKDEGNEVMERAKLTLLGFGGDRFDFILAVLECAMSIIYEKRNNGRYIIDIEE